jgi:hypothetical protein
VAGAAVRLQSQTPDGPKPIDTLSRSDGRAIVIPGWEGLATEVQVTITAPAAKPVTLSLKPGSSTILPVVIQTRAQAPQALDLAFVIDCSLDDFAKAISAQRADGGGDEPEAVQVAFAEAAKLQWDTDPATARVCFHIADAGPHPQDIAQTLDHVRDLVHRGVAIYPVAASGASPDCELIMRICAMLSGAEYLFLTDDSGLGNAHRDPLIPFFRVETLSDLMQRMIAAELSGRKIGPDKVIRTVGEIPSGT